ncbi:MAG: hypothetical protein ACRCXZ_00310 [Patescibacteria group bacterium]
MEQLLKMILEGAKLLGLKVDLNSLDLPSLLAKVANLDTLKSELINQFGSKLGLDLNMIEKLVSGLNLQSLNLDDLKNFDLSKLDLDGLMKGAGMIGMAGLGGDLLKNLGDNPLQAAQEAYEKLMKPSSESSTSSAVETPAVSNLETQTSPTTETTIQPEDVVVNEQVSTLEGNLETQIDSTEVASSDLLNSQEVASTLEVAPTESMEAIQSGEVASVDEESTPQYGETSSPNTSYESEILDNAALESSNSQLETPVDEVVGGVASSENNFEGTMQGYQESTQSNTSAELNESIVTENTTNIDEPVSDQTSQSTSTESAQTVNSESSSNDKPLELNPIDELVKQVENNEFAKDILDKTGVKLDDVKAAADQAEGIIDKIKGFFSDKK